MDFSGFFFDHCSKGELKEAKGMSKFVDMNKCAYFGFKYACCSGHKNVAEWLLEEYSDKIDITEHTYFILNDTCSMNQIEMAKWLMDMHPDSVLEYSTFENVCMRGLLDMAKWMYSKRKFRVTNSTFLLVCINQHLEVAQWLFEIDPNIDISYNMKHPLRYACTSDNIEMMKWLLSIVPDAFEDEMFYDACSYHGFCDTAKYLYLRFTKEKREEVQRWARDWCDSVEKSIEKLHNAVGIFEQYWLNVYYSPYTEIGIKRLNREYDTLVEEGVICS